jgi:gamma-glutamyl hercynylcysteine S-oxide synthase
MTLIATSGLDRAGALERFRRIRARTRMLFDVLEESVYHERPIPLRNPIVFYEGHLPAFAVNTLLKRGLGRPGIDDRLEQIFARGIDPDTEAAAIARGNPAWPSRAEVLAYAAAADEAIAAAIESAPLEVPGHPTLDRAQALWTILEHEEMHQETLAYMWHEVGYDKKRTPNFQPPTSKGAVPLQSGVPNSVSELGIGSGELGADCPRVAIPAGFSTLGTGEDQAFAWDNERPAHVVQVDAFEIDVHNVTNARFMAFVEAGGYQDSRWWGAEDWAWVRESQIAHPRFWQRDHNGWSWRGMFERIALPPDWPVYVTWAEANAYARWRGMRLPSEAEFHRAAFATPSGHERAFPWGDAPRTPPSANFDFRRWDPEPVGSDADGVSAFGVHDLVGNGWEWTSTVFGPFPGFAPLPSYPEYSADFFDEGHYVMKGASPVTAAPLTRRGFRNWFRPRYPYVYATFRCVNDTGNNR